ncbi:hypothetical protein BCR32DRAFT_270245 [Anaeromyces robustus]|uniref:G-protein coupled receptors family 3 profile domain-containing protein n=1 Tax=Anaeromyces robustus TaxID=1754192 RepID=A0A1Y1WX67_9FUNG|nr:hypothetical protein BCR32DRAFT_270245 [Anaeromyces robustus]|eukprot:ORX78130.1 hypothetical protein BCR32DRAFT_270245 [Anaeromyces robustus]
MKFINSTISLYIISYFLFLIEKINTKEVINILINPPNISTENEQYLNNYNEQINQYLVSKNIDFGVNFSYCVPEPTDGESVFYFYQSANTFFSVDTEFARNFNCTLRELKSSNYDMMILDDRFLFSDDSYITNTILESLFGFDEITNFYVNYNNDHKIKKETLSHHSANILKDGTTVDNKLYGLPYEFDFDVLYYYPEATEIKDLLSKVQNLEGWKNLDPSGVLSVGLGNNDEIINFFAEFVRYQYDIPKEEDPSTYNKLYDRKSNDLFNLFRDYVTKLMGNNMEKSLSISNLEAYNSFMNGEKRIYKGKASDHHYFKNNNQNVTILADSLPGGKSVVSEKYLVINKNSQKPIDQLVQFAIELTSPEIQIYRSEQFGTLPTFDLKNLSNNDFANAYCSGENSGICTLYEQLKPILITKVLKKSRYSANYLESRLVLPISLRNTLTSKDNNVIIKTFSNLLDIWNDSLETFKLNPITALLMGLNSLSFFTVIYLFWIIYKVYRNRKHPYIKAMSPYLTNITIIGIALKIIYPYTLNYIRTNYLCRMNVVINFFIDNLIYTPLFAIIFRIYYIYTNVTNMSCGKKLHDKRIIRYIILILFLTFMAFYILTAWDHFILITTGSIALTRTITCFYDFAKYALYSNIYTVFMFILMMGMTIKVHKLSKKYGDTKFIFFIVLLLITSFVVQQAFSTFMSTSNIDQVSTSLLFTIFLQLTTSVITVHLLIGNRILYIKKHPIKNKSKFNSSDFKNINNIANFVAMKKDMNSSFSMFDTTKNSSKNTSEIYINMNSSYNTSSNNKKDQFMSNNQSFRSFSHTLQDLNSSYNDNSNGMLFNSVINNDNLRNYNSNNNNYYNNYNGSSNNNSNSYFYLNNLSENSNYNRKINFN